MPFTTKAGANRPCPQPATTPPPDTGGRRSEKDRRRFSYTAYIPERRDVDDRRSGDDRRRLLRTPHAEHTGDEAAAGASGPGHRTASRS